MGDQGLRFWSLWLTRWLDPALLAALINIGKYFGLIGDDNAPKVSMIAHLVAYGGVGVLVYLGKVDLLAGIDLQLSAVAGVLLALLAFLSSLGVAGGFHNRVLRGLPVVGFSFPLRG